MVVKASRIAEFISTLPSFDGLYGNIISFEHKRSLGSIGFGALGDSFYEYLLKTWIQGGKTEPMYRLMYDRAIDGMVENLLFTSSPSNLTYVAIIDQLGVRNHPHLFNFHIVPRLRTKWTTMFAFWLQPWLLERSQIQRGSTATDLNET